MNAITPFIFDDQPLRVFDREGQPWFVLADACTLLGLKNPSVVAKPLDETERAKIFIGSGSEATIVSLPGLLTLMVRCRGALKPGTLAYRVRKWVTGDVIPTIMRTGGYGRPVPALDLHDPATLHRLLLDHTSAAMAAQARVAELEPQAKALARLTDADGALCITDAAKALGIGPRELFGWLERNEWIYRRAGGGHWIGYQRRIAAGLVEHKVTRIEQRSGPAKFREQVLLTPKGIARIAEQLSAAR